MSSTAGAARLPETVPLAGDRGMIGRYRLCSELGRGGMGVVHLALDERGRAVALKVLRDHVVDDPAARARLSREVEHLARVRHRGVATVLDADVQGPRPYVVMRYVPGPSLDRFVAEHGPLDPERLLMLAQDLSDALSAVHAAGVVHRDLKPANVLLHDGHPVLIDFGIAHGADEARITSTGLVMGTPGFLAPEILDGARVTPATDWWAWAATLAFAAAGRMPFGDGPADVVLARIRAGECDLTGVDPRLAPLLRAALDPRPAARPTQERILGELARYAAAGPATQVLTPPPATRSLPRVAPPGAFPGGTPRFAPGAGGPGASVPPPASYGPGGPAGGAPAGPYAAPAPVGAYPAPAPGAAAGPAAPPPPAPFGVAYLRSTGLVLALAAVLTALTLVAPPAALGVGVLWSWVARAVGSAVGAVVGALLPTLVGAGVVVGAITLQGAGVVPGVAADPSAPAPLFLGAVAAQLVAWWGPGGGTLRRGTRVALRAMAPGRHGPAVVGAALLLIAAVIALVSQSSGFEPSWLPLSDDPFRWARGLAGGL